MRVMVWPGEPPPLSKMESKTGWPYISTLARLHHATALSVKPTMLAGQELGNLPGWNWILLSIPKRSQIQASLKDWTPLCSGTTTIIPTQQQTGKRYQIREGVQSLLHQPAPLARKRHHRIKDLQKDRPTGVWWEWSRQEMGKSLPASERELVHLPTTALTTSGADT